MKYKIKSIFVMFSSYLNILAGLFQSASLSLYHGNSELQAANLPLLCGNPGQGFLSPGEQTFPRYKTAFGIPD